MNAILLILSLITVVGLAEVLSPEVEEGVKAAETPKTIVGIEIAILVFYQKDLQQSEQPRLIEFKAV